MHLFVLFLWETMSVAIFSILLNQLRHHIINASKNWGSIAFMVNCILNFQCSVFTFQASLHVSLQILILHVRRDYWVCLLGPLWRTSLYSTVWLCNWAVRVQTMLLHNYCTLQISSALLAAARKLCWKWIFSEAQVDHGCFFIAIQNLWFKIISFNY